MSFSILKQIGDAQKKKAVVDVRSGDTVRVTQKIKEGNKFRLQVFEGVVIRVDRKESHTARIVVRKVTSGVGVEKSYLIHSPLVEKIEITKRSKVRRNNLSYLRQRSGKSARLRGKDFDRVAVNDVTVPEEEATEVKEEAEVEVVETPAEEVKEETEKVEEIKEVAEETKEEKEEAKEETEAEAKDEAEKEAEA
ncbi:50S ribosomal protein L19 [Candidatus Saccharibacteria bacterium]|nr:50S ribosomal protein L19 [Candidatus Saccharibacteria bacterium]